MIKNFNDFINENHTKVQLSDKITEPFNELIYRMKERTDLFEKQIKHILEKINLAIDNFERTFESILIGEPTINISDDLSEISVTFDTNIPNNDEAWEDDESPAQELDYRVSRFIDKINLVKNVYASVETTPNADGNCQITFSADVIDDEHFGDFTDAIIKLGEEY